MFDANMYKYRELGEFGEFLKVSVRFYGARETVGMRQNQSLQRNVSFSSFLSFSFSFSFFFLFFTDNVLLELVELHHRFRTRGWVRH